MGQRRSDTWVVPFTVMVWLPLLLEHSSLSATEINADSRQHLNQECLLEGLMLKLKVKYFGHLMRRADSLEKP